MVKTAVIAAKIRQPDERHRLIGVTLPISCPDPPLLQTPTKAKLLIDGDCDDLSAAA
jgi:hypothetical protein